MHVQTTEYSSVGVNLEQTVVQQASSLMREVVAESLCLGKWFGGRVRAGAWGSKKGAEAG
jgi:hypothetical protein